MDALTVLQVSARSWWVTSHSWKARSALERAQKELNLPSHSLISECQTRWGSRQKMISRILEQQKAITQVLSEDRKTQHLILTWQDMDVLESVTKSLGPLLDFTDALLGEDYVSVSYVKPVCQFFNTSMQLIQEGDTDLTKTLKTEMLHYINKKYRDEATQELLDAASCLDTRFKMDFISEDNKPQVKARVASEMMECQEETSGSSTEVEPEVAGCKSQAKITPRNPWEVSLNRAELQQRVIPL
ncbi:zinc finger BED domain-containing protein 4-like [Esox lucius]|uniref:zinc finger BED domain-containing protein 4-like n=1 Tax=Esox lucius TaxID=8010 RepID=UPI001476B210|nr:zinc finger BED domain-containing protein 4-like [Esox lucius]